MEPNGETHFGIPGSAKMSFVSNDPTITEVLQLKLSAP